MVERVATLSEIRSTWSFYDVWDANAALDLWHAVQEPPPEE